MKKWTTTLVLSGILALSMPLFVGVNTPITADASNVVESALRDTARDSGSVKFSNSVLESRLKSLLGLASTDELKSDSLITSNIYNNANATKSLKSLDLSNTGITDITELRQFVWPKTLEAINLANNGITEADFDKIKQFETYTSGETITISANGETYDIYASGTLNEDNTVSESVSLKNINLMFNDINLNQISSDLSNTKYLFGLQGVDTWDENSLVLSSEYSNVKFYFRSNDFSIISGRLNKNNLDTTPEFTQNFGVVTTLLDSDDLGSVNFSFSGIAYYKDWSFSKSYKVIDVKLNSPVKLERRSMFTLADHQITTRPSNKVTTTIIGNPDTSRVGTNSFYLKVQYEGRYRDIELPYQVVDTTPPVLSFRGSETTYWSKNKPFDYTQGITAMDSSIDSITEPTIKKTTKKENEVLSSDYATPNMITIVTNLDVTTLSGSTPYFIKYFCTDQSGNSATPITRYVYIQEQALDTIVLRCNSESTIIDSEIVLEVKPDSNIQMDNYSGFTYKYIWYVDGKHAYTTTGDFNAKSTQTLVFETLGMKEIRVDLVATKDGETIKLSSNTLYLDISAKIDNTMIVLISFSVAVLLIIMFFSIRVIIKVRKSKKTVSKKSSTSSYKGASTNSTKPNITIIQGVNPRDQGSGGNSNSRPPENGGHDMK